MLSSFNAHFALFVQRTTQVSIVILTLDLALEVCKTTTVAIGRPDNKQNN